MFSCIKNHIKDPFTLILKNHKKAIEYIKDKDNNINVKRKKDGNTLLMVASENSSKGCSLEIVKCLVDAGARLNMKSNEGNTALMMASRYSSSTSSLETVKFLVDSGANLDLQNNDGWTALMSASRSSRLGSSFETVKYLIDSGADVNIENFHGWTTATLASRYTSDRSSLETVDYLIINGIDINKQQGDGWTILHLLSRYDQSIQSGEIIKELLNYKRVDQTIQTNNGDTFLHLLISNSKHVEFLKTIIKMVDPRILVIRNNNGISPLTYIGKNYKSLIGFVRDYLSELQSIIGIDKKSIPIPFKVYDDDTCPICLDDMGTGKCYISCGHTFHVQCINRHYDTRKHYKCPMCSKNNVLEVF